MPDAIDELVARSKPHKELKKFHDFHRENPDVLDFLVAEIQNLRKCGHTAFSYQSLMHYCRWKLIMRRKRTTTFKLNDHLCQFYARAIPILHPDLNGLAAMRSSRADEAFGVQVALTKANGSYARPLQWADGARLEDGWRPVRSHVVTHAPGRRQNTH